MALVEPLVGHLLSQYKETVLEGLEKIQANLRTCDAAADTLATAIAQHDEAIRAICDTLEKTEYFIPAMQTVAVILERLKERGHRVAVVREVLRGPSSVTAHLRGLSGSSDDSLSRTIAVFHFLRLAAADAPRLVLSRLWGHRSALQASKFGAPGASTSTDVPFHLPAFRLALTYGQRRLRLSRVNFLLQLVTSPMHRAPAETICSHGFLTHLLEDAAELVREGTTAGMAAGAEVVSVVQKYFVSCRQISAARKRRVLLGQRNVFRLLVKALLFDPIAEVVTALLQSLVTETIESPADYASTRVESLDDHGMPNYILFFLLRQLRPKVHERMGRLVIFILQSAPDLIRPYFTRISGHLAEDGNAHDIAPTTARVAVINVVTRAFLCPMPHHLSGLHLTLELLPAKANTFYTMCPRDVADEICPPWVAEYVHSLINGTSNLLFLVLAMQLTEAALQRGKAVLRLLHAAQAKQLQRRSFVSTAQPPADNGEAANQPPLLSGADLATLAGEQETEENWDMYNASVLSQLQAALPRWEEFWHRMTQQLHQRLSSAATTTSSSSSSSDKRMEATAAGEEELRKTHVVVQRMLMLMNSYVEVLDLRHPWMSAVPAVLPPLHRGNPASSLMQTNVSKKVWNPITECCNGAVDVLHQWPPESVVFLCQLLIAGQRRGVAMSKLHHINMSHGKTEGIGEWPLLLSLLLWGVQHAGRAAVAADAAVAVGWIAQLIQWTVLSVTVQCSCTYAEAQLWLSCLTATTAPLFVHVINHLLTRSLSKVAHRVTQELGESAHGVLVAAAEHFIIRVEERMAQGGAEAVAKTPRNAAKAGSGGTAAKGGKLDLWTQHLYATLPAFKSVVATVVQRWEAKNTAGSSLVSPSAQLLCRQLKSQHDRVKGQLLRATLKSIAAVSLTHHASMTAPWSQLILFTRTLQSPVPPAAEGDEAERMELLRGAERAEVDTATAASSSHQQFLSALHKNGVSGTQPWYTLDALCWQMAGVVLRRVDAWRPSSSDSDKGEESLRQWTNTQQLAYLLLQEIIVAEGDVSSLLELYRRDGTTTGLLVLLNACLCCLLSAAIDGERCPNSSAGPPAALTAANVATLERLHLQVYCASLTTIDRLCYASLLALHYLLEDRPATAVRHGVAAPRGLVNGRFLLWGHADTASRTAEVEMLAWHLDSLTDEEILRMAMQSSVRLHTAMPCEKGAPAAWGLLQGAYPELSSPADIEIADMTELTAAEVLDPRYMVPLVQRVAALPSTASARPLLAARFMPVLLRALSSVDPRLREVSAAALATAYVPKGPLRVAVGLARLKLCAMAAATSSAASKVPRLPAALSTLLSLALSPLGRYADPLHHHLIHFLMETDEALQAPLPFARWLSAFPLEAVSAPLTIERQEALLQKRSNSIAHASAGNLMEELRRDTPPHLTFVTQIIAASSGVEDDALAVLQSEALNSLMLLSSLLTSSDAQRTVYLQCLLVICSQTAAITTCYASQGHLLTWATSYLFELCQEYGRSSPHNYSSSAFMTALRLLEKMANAIAALAAPVGIDADQLRQQLEIVRQLQRHLADAHVTSMEILQVLDKVQHLLQIAQDKQQQQQQEAKKSAMARTTHRRIDGSNARSVRSQKRHREMEMKQPDEEQIPRGSVPVKQMRSS